jgi:hypothetical protein
MLISAEFSQDSEEEFFPRTSRNQLHYVEFAFHATVLLPAVQVSNSILLTRYSIAAARVR